MSEVPVISLVWVEAGVVKFRDQPHGLYLPHSACVAFAVLLRNCAHAASVGFPERRYASVIREFAHVARDPAICDVFGSGTLPMTKVNAELDEGDGSTILGIENAQNRWPNHIDGWRQDFGFAVVRNVHDAYAPLGLYLPSKTCAKLAAVLDAFADGFYDPASDRFSALALDASVLAAAVQVPLGGIVAGGTIDMTPTPKCAARASFGLSLQQPCMPNYEEAELGGPSKPKPSAPSSAETRKREQRKPGKELVKRDTASSKAGPSSGGKAKKR